MTEANSESFKGDRGRWAVLPMQLLHYAVALLSVALAVGTNLLLNPYLDPTPTPPFFAAVMVSAWYGGLGPGLLATALSTLAINYFFVEPIYSLNIPNLGTLVRLGVFVMAAIPINSLNAAQRVAQRRAEANLQFLRESEARFGRLAESNIIGIIVADLNGPILEANDIFLQMVGYTHEELRSGRLRWREMTPPESLEVSERAVQELITTGACTPFEKEYICKDGSRIPVLHGATMTGETTVIGFVLDLSDRKRSEADRKRAEEALRTSEEGYRAIYDQVVIGICQADLTGKIISVNERFCEIVGRSREELLTLRMQNITHPDDLPKNLVLFQQMVREGTSFDIEKQYIRPDGSIVWVRNYVSLIRDAAGQPQFGVAVTEDITEQKQAEADLNEQRHLLETILKHTADAIIVCDASGKLTFANPEARRLAQQDPNGTTLDLDLLKWGTAYDADGNLIPLKNYAISKALRGEVNNVFESRVVRADGSYYDILVSAAPLLNDGQIVGAVANFIDISDRKRAEEALRASEERFQLIVQATNDVIWDCNLLTHQMWWSERLHLVFGYQPEELGLDMSGWAERVHPDDLERVHASYETCLNTGETLWTDEYRFRRADGSYADILDRAYIIRDSAGNPVRVVGAMSDITDRKQAELEIRKFVSLTDNSTEFIGMCDMNFVPFYVNAAGRQMVGLDDVRQYSETPVREFFFPEDQDFIVNEFFSSVLREGQAEVEIRFRHFKTGEALWMIYNVFYIRDENDQPIGLATVSRNITDRKRAEAERERLLAREQAAREQAEAANRIKDEFLAVLSHELRSPLNPILGWAKLLRSGKLDEQKTAQALETIERNASLQTQLIGDLLDVSRILQGKLSLNIAPVDLATTIAAAMETVRLAAEAKSIQIHTALNSAIGKVSGDSGRLQQILWNLLANAVKFTPEGGRVEVRLERVGTQAQITVSDTGKGISPDFLPYVFDYFRQADGATTRKFGGLGLGLAIVRHLTELHGGTVTAQSLGEGQGATFTVRLPLIEEGTRLENEPSPNSSTDELAASPLVGLSILVVDDDADTRDYLSFVLEQAGATVICAVSADEALQLLVGSTPDILLSDIGMPEMDGYMLMRRVRAMPSDRGGKIPAIALTAYAGEMNQQQAIAAGFQQHISKPVEPEILIQEIGNMVSLVGERVGGEVIRANTESAL